MKYKTVLFDLDGTLSRSGDGVHDGIIHALNTLNADVPDLSDYSRYIGPPLIDTFQNVAGLNEENAVKAIALYKEHYLEHGKYKNEAYEGITELLQHLKENGVHLAVATTKNEGFAKWVVEYIGLSKYFEAICGVPDDYSIKEKYQVIQRALGRIEDSDINSTVMICDSKFDTEGARLAGCDFIGVTYGYGKREQMEKEGARLFADSADDLYDML